MPKNKRDIEKLKKEKQDFENEIIRKIVTFLEKSEFAFNRKEIIDKVPKIFTLEEQEYVKSFINVSELESFSDRIKTDSEDGKKYYYVIY